MLSQHSASPPASPSSILPGIEHVVVLMFGNRSFDNVLGNLYPRSANFEGIPPDASNSYSRDGIVHEVTVTDVPPSGRSPFITPFPDPGESYDDMTAQIFNSGSAPTMSGFAQNYADIGLTDERVPGDIMVCLTPDQMFVSNSLARHFAVCDQWFASAPVQTFANRMFCHCGTPGMHEWLWRRKARVDNGDFIVRPSVTMEAVAGAVQDRSIFELLDRGSGAPDPANWKIYFHDVPMSMINAYVNDAWKAGSPCVASYDGSDYKPPYGSSFADDVTNGRLPAYAFIEPRYFDDYSGSGRAPNSNHPGKSAFLDFGETPIDVRDGETLLADVFLTLATNPELFDKTLLIVTYDEHGGLYDHVAPNTSPFADSAPSPFTQPVENFDYTRLGVRVPSFFINPRIISGQVYRPANGSGPIIPFDHCSIIATLCAHFGLDGPLTSRDAAAPLLTGLIQMDETDVGRMTSAVTAIQAWKATRPVITPTPAQRIAHPDHDAKLVAHVRARSRPYRKESR